MSVTSLTIKNKLCSAFFPPAISFYMLLKYEDNHTIVISTYMSVAYDFYMASDQSRPVLDRNQIFSRKIESSGNSMHSKCSRKHREESVNEI